MNQVIIQVTQNRALGLQGGEKTGRPGEWLNVLTKRIWGVL